MPRSEEAMQRRAEKRQRTLQEQKKVDIEDVRKREKLEEASRTGARPRSSFQAPRSYMNDSRPPPKKQLRHDPETSKALVWAEQADEDKISKNQALRNKYKQTGGEGMDPEELERAKLLIARDERKKLKKQKKKENPGESGVEEGKEEGQESSENVLLDNNKSSQDGSSTEAKDENEDNGAEGKEPPSKIPEKDRKKEHDAKCKKNAKANRDRNNALRKRYQETSGKGMNPADAKRAKQLLERDERKKQKRAAAVQTQ